MGQANQPDNRKCYPNGNVKMTYTKNERGEYHGLVTHFSESGVKVSETTYVNGRTIGKFKMFHPNGVEKMTGEHSEYRELAGLVITFDEKGNKISERNYVRGILNGDIKTFYPDGSLESEGYMKDNKKHLEYKLYDKTGKIVEYILYDNGYAKKWHPASIKINKSEISVSCFEEKFNETVNQIRNNNPVPEFTSADAPIQQEDSIEGSVIN